MTSTAASDISKASEGLFAPTPGAVDLASSSTPPTAHAPVRQGGDDDQSHEPIAEGTPSAAADETLDAVRGADTRLHEAPRTLDEPSLDPSDPRYKWAKRYEGLWCLSKELEQLSQYSTAARALKKCREELGDLRRRGPPARSLDAIREDIRNLLPGVGGEGSGVGGGVALVGAQRREVNEQAERTTIQIKDEDDQR